MLRATFALKLTHSPSVGPAAAWGGDSLLRHHHIAMAPSWSSPLSRTRVAGVASAASSPAASPTSSSSRGMLAPPEVEEISSDSDDDEDSVTGSGSAVQLDRYFASTWTPSPLVRRHRALAVAPPAWTTTAMPRTPPRARAAAAAAAPLPPPSPAHAAATDSVVAALHAAVAAESAASVARGVGMALRLALAERETAALRKRTAAAEGMASRSRLRDFARKSRAARAAAAPSLSRADVLLACANAVAAAHAAEGAAARGAAEAEAAMLAHAEEFERTALEVERVIEANRKIAHALADAECRAKVERDSALKLCRQEVREKLRCRLIEALGASAVKGHAAKQAAAAAGETSLGDGAPWKPIPASGGDGDDEGDDADVSWYAAQFESELQVLSDARRVAHEIDALPTLRDDDNGDESPERGTGNGRRHST